MKQSSKKIMPEARKKEEKCESVVYKLSQVEIPPEVAPGPSNLGYPSHNQLATCESSTAEVHRLDLNIHFQRVLPLVMDRAIGGVYSTVLQRTVSITTDTTVKLALKDYITEPNEILIKSASSMLVCLAGDLSYAICKEPLRIRMFTELHKSLQGLVVVNESLEQTLLCVVDANLEFGCAAIKTAAVDKGLIMLKQVLSHQLSVRGRHTEASGPAIYYPIQLAQENIDPQQQVYARTYQLWDTNTPMTTAANELGVHDQTSFPPSDFKWCLTGKVIKPSYTTDYAVAKVLKLLKKLEELIGNNTNEGEIQSIIAEVRGIILKCLRQDEAALAIAQKVFEGLYNDAANYAHVYAYVAVLASIYDVNKLVRNNLTHWVLNSENDRKFNKDITVALIQRDLLNLPEYCFHMAQVIAAGKNWGAIEFSISLVRTLEICDVRVIPQLHFIINALAKVGLLVPMYQPHAFWPALM